MSGLLSTFMNWATWPAVLQSCQLSCWTCSTHILGNVFSVFLSKISQDLLGSQKGLHGSCVDCVGTSTAEDVTRQRKAPWYSSQWACQHIYQANAKTRLACIPKATKWEDTLFKENLATWRICASFELARSHKPTSCSTCRHPASHLRSRSPLSTHPFPGRANVFSKNGIKKHLKSTFLCQNLDGSTQSTHSYWKAKKHAFQIGHGLTVGSCWTVPSQARSSGSLRELLDDPCVNTTALCHPEHPKKTPWPIISIMAKIMAKWSDQNIPSVLVFENFCSKACPWPKEAPKGPKAQSISSSPWQKHHLKHNANLRVASEWTGLIPLRTCVTQNLSWTSWTSWTV